VTGRAFPNCPIPTVSASLLNAFLVNPADNPQKQLLRKKFVFVNPILEGLPDAKSRIV
jgi:hypothetical protein